MPTETEIISLVRANIAMAIDQNENVDDYIDNIGDTLAEMGLRDDRFAQQIAVDEILHLLKIHGLTSEIYNV